jgi:hypothetical protein
MNVRQRQSGMTIPGIAVIMIMVGFFLMCAVRMSPPYFEFLSVKGIIGRLVMEPEIEAETTTRIRRTIETRFNTNQIYELDPRDVEVYRRKGKTYVDASYEVRLPIFGRIDAVLKFDDLLFEIGVADPITAMPVLEKR